MYVKLHDCIVEIPYTRTASSTITTEIYKKESFFEFASVATLETTRTLGIVLYG